MTRHIFRDREAALWNTSVLLWVSAGWMTSFWLMATANPWLNALGVLLCAHMMVLGAYLIHEAAHQTLFAEQRANFALGEAMSFVAGSSYASFERIRHMHIRHHMDRVDLTCFDFKGLLDRRPWLCRMLQLLEWCYIPATEILMHLQVVWRPVFVPSQRQYLRRAMLMLVLRVGLLAILALWSVKAVLLYFVALGIMLHVLNFFDAFHHTFDQYFVRADEAVPSHDRSRAYEQSNTYSNLIATRHTWLNLLTLNFGYHNAHHEKASVPWYRLPAFHRRLYGSETPAVLPVSELLRTWHCNRVRRVKADHYGGPGKGGRRADGFVGAHGVSFLTVI
jgi:fatty acid desaturase